MKIITTNHGENILVDNKDFKLLIKYKWYVDYLYGRPHYVARTTTENRKRIMISRFITNCPLNKVVDHIDGNPLNNQRNNLRICELWQNSLNKKTPITNTTGFRGISIEKRDGRKPVFLAAITFQKKFYKKRNKDINVCIKWREDMEQKLFGQFKRII